MDDLKVYARDDKEFEGIFSTVKQFSDDIDMEFGLDKCTKAKFRKGNLTCKVAVELGKDTAIHKLDQNEPYKYLGIDEGNIIQHNNMEERIRKECYRQTRAILKTELNSANKIEVINTLTVALVKYSFNVINWNLQDFRGIYTKIRKLLASYKMLYPKLTKTNDIFQDLKGAEVSFKQDCINIYKQLRTG